MTVDIRQYDLAQARSLLEPQRQNNWMLHISLADNRGLRDMQIALEGFTPPVESSAKVSLGLINYQSHVPGVTSNSDMTLTCKDLVDRDVAAMFLRWRYMVSDPRTGVVGLAKNFKKIVEVSLFAPDGSHERVYRYHGCWPLSVNPGRFDMNNGDKVLLEVPISCDRVEPLFA